MARIGWELQPFIFEPIRLAARRSNKDREARFGERLGGLARKPRVRRHSAEEWLRYLTLEEARLSVLPARSNRARERIRLEQQYMRREEREMQALARHVAELRRAMQDGGPIAQRAALLAWELGTWESERAYREAAETWEALSKAREDQAKRPSDRRMRRAAEHARWLELAQKYSRPGVNARAQWVAKQAGCPDRWRTVRDFLRRDSLRRESDEVNE